MKSKRVHFLLRDIVFMNTHCRKRLPGGLRYIQSVIFHNGLHSHEIQYQYGSFVFEAFALTIHCFQNYSVKNRQCNDSPTSLFTVFQSPFYRIWIAQTIRLPINSKTVQSMQAKPDFRIVMKKRPKWISGCSKIFWVHYLSFLSPKQAYWCAENALSMLLS